MASILFSIKKGIYVFLCCFLQKGGSDQWVEQLQHLYCAEMGLSLLQIARQGDAVEEVVRQQQLGSGRAALLSREPDSLSWRTLSGMCGLGLPGSASHTAVAAWYHALPAL